MELVAASKMKRVLSNTLASRLYSEYSSDILTSVIRNIEEIKHPLFNEVDKNTKDNKILLLLITSNRGLCGAYNAQVIKKTISFLKESEKVSAVDLVVVGKKGDTFMRRMNKNIIATFDAMPDNISYRDVLPISKLLINEYTELRYNKILVAYTDFVSALTQKPNIRQFLPISKESVKDIMDSIGPNKENIASEEKQKESKTNYLIEGDMHELIPALAEKIIRMQIYQMLLESNASEQSARMMAMKNASEASSEMIEDLTLMFNKARQANITREISEISAGMASLV